MKYPILYSVLRISTLPLTQTQKLIKISSLTNQTTKLLTFPRGYQISIPKITSLYSITFLNLYSFILTQSYTGSNMSARAYRKVLNEQEQVRKAEVDVIPEEVEDNSEEDESYSAAPSVNIFDLLNDNDDTHESDQEDEPSEVHEESMEKVDKSKSVAKSQVAPLSTTNKKNNKKKKKKNKQPLSSNGNGSSASLETDLEALCLKIKSSNEVGSSKKISKKDVQIIKQPKSSILNVDPKLLNAENELRRIFGSKVVSQFENSNQTGTSRQARGAKRGGHVHRKSLLVSPSEHWPRWDGCLSMEHITSKDGIHYFRYVHSASYSQGQRTFEAAKAIHDLNGVASVLMHHPYHVESLLTLADYFRFSGEHQTAADFIAKCLYALECAWHSMFTPLQGNSRLEYTHETNKPFFTTLFSHMKNLDRRGCHRSALQVCKLLLSLDPVDPVGALFCIDYFSLRAEEYLWLEQFSEQYQSDNSLWNFPNFAYSLAICRFYLEREESSKNEKETSVGLMKQALMLHPSVLKRLILKVPLKDKAWKTITLASIFKLEESGILSLDHLIRIYVERSYIIWRLPDVHKLLKDAALEVVETLNHDSSEANTWAVVRKEMFPSEKNEYNHLLVSDFSDTVATMPPENLQDFLMVDPRMGDMVENQNQNQGPHVAIPAPRELANRNPLAVLLESVLPWVHFETDGAGNHDQPHEDD